MKTKPTADTENTPDVLPTREQLAALAVASQRRNPADAVRYALAVWCEAGATIKQAADAQARRDLSDVPLPENFPATLADFLRLVVNAKTQGDGIALLRRFYRETYEEWCKDEQEAANRAVNEITAWKADGFKTEAKWVQLARRFRKWRTQDKSRAAKESALKRSVAKKSR